jgi:uncharacterized protein (TIGR02246 family)
MELIEELATERDIRKLLAHYAQRTDDLDAQGWIDLFTDDGCMVIGPQRIQGREALTTWIRTIYSGPKMRHLMTNAIINVESPVAARVTFDSALLRAEGGRWVLVASPRYTSILTRTERGWKVRECNLDLRTP